jgi:hypothetical protein
LDGSSGKDESWRRATNLKLGHFHMNEAQCSTVQYCTVHRINHHHHRSQVLSVKEIGKTETSLFPLDLQRPENSCFNRECSTETRTKLTPSTSSIILKQELLYKKARATLRPSQTSTGKKTRPITTRATTNKIGQKLAKVVVQDV